jgi:uncharacterized membrane protein YsdA (DUF1294 family)
LAAPAFIIHVGWLYGQARGREACLVGSPYARYGLPALVLAIIVAVVTAVWAGADGLVSWVIGCSLATFLLYGVDKGIAKTRGVRVPEIVLHVFAFAGGFVGGWLGRWAFRHKTQHASFTAVLVASTSGWVALLVWWLWLR